jgi:hypothetical protein
MNDSSRNDIALLWVKLDRLILEVDDEHSVDNIEELIDVVVLVPVVFAFDNSNPDYGVVDFAESLVEPLVFYSVDYRLDVDELEWWKLDVESSVVGKVCGIGRHLFIGRGKYNRHGGTVITEVHGNCTKAFKG